MAELRVTGLGATVALVPETPAAEELLPLIRNAWEWCLDILPNAVDAGVVPIAEPGGSSVAETLQRLTQRITQTLIGARAGQLFLFHASAVCHPRTGATLMAVAPGGTGKTTLARHFGRSYGYLSDETVAIEDDGRIVPYPKPLSIRGESGPKLETSPADLGLIRPAVPATLAGVVLLTRDPGFPPPVDVLELPTLDAMAEMAPESSSLSAIPNPLRRLADLLAPVAPVLRVTYSEVGHLAPLVEELVGTP